MISWMLGRSLTQFEKDNAYDATYLREVLEASPSAFVRFMCAGGVGSYREDVPADVYHAAKITASLHIDCGSCVQLAIQWAVADGVDEGLLRAVVAGDRERMPEPVRLAVAYVDAVFSRSMEIEALCAQLEARHGARGVVSLAFAILGAQLYPTLKFALGHGKTCTAVEIGGARVVRRETPSFGERALGHGI